MSICPHADVATYQLKRIVSGGCGDFKPRPFDGSDLLAVRFQIDFLHDLRNAHHLFPRRNRVVDVGSPSFGIVGVVIVDIRVSDGL